MPPPTEPVLLAEPRLVRTWAERVMAGERTERAKAEAALVRGAADDLPLSNDLWFVGLGLNYKINDSIIVGLGYRSEFRSGADNLNSVNLSTVFRF